MVHFPAGQIVYQRLTDESVHAQSKTKESIMSDPLHSHIIPKMLRLSVLKQLFVHLIVMDL